MSHITVTGDISFFCECEDCIYDWAESLRGSDKPLGPGKRRKQ